jgi:hypothetical protein
MTGMGVIIGCIIIYHLISIKHTLKNKNESDNI